MPLLAWILQSTFRPFFSPMHRYIPQHEMCVHRILLLLSLQSPPQECSSCRSLHLVTPASQSAGTLQLIPVVEVTCSTGLATAGLGLSKPPLLQLLPTCTQSLDCYHCQSIGSQWCQPMESQRDYPMLLPSPSRVGPL